MDKIRYLRHDLIDWFSQSAIADTEVIVIGAGAVGNEVLKNLALLGVGKIKIYDCDKIEEHNLTRSVLFRDTDVGRYKSEVAAQRISDLDPNIAATAFVGDFWNLLRIDELKAADVVFCCVDSFEARIKCNTLCFLGKVDLINAGLDSRNAVVETFPFSSSVSAACYECSLPPSVYTRISERYSCGSLKKLSYVEKKIPTTILTSAAAGYLAVSSGLRLGDTEAGEHSIRFFADTINGTTSRSKIARNPLCPCCGRFGDANVMHVKSRRRIGQLDYTEDVEQTIETSEPILVQYQANDTLTVVFENASDYDSTFTQSVSEDPDSVVVDIRDQFVLSELVERFPDRDMPCKFAIVRSFDEIYVLEFEESKHGAS
ncbi:ThiF family adenylyltransferase [Pseudooceanicola sp. LIPI14-2-Ac024]|uniref:HesA/MoeB/ThiF family protein n=1 Tax=Pseudooceanicola sp. LIPI14-2-Ac024 TaxID=3344875 RepID=UPI0035D09287